MSANFIAAENLAQAIRQVARDAAAELWGITDRELREIRRSLGQGLDHESHEKARKARKGFVASAAFRGLRDPKPPME
jgi:hypothetical protein